MFQYSRTVSRQYQLPCCNCSCSLFFQNCEWETIASLALLNTAQNSVITAGLLAGTLYCGKLVVDGSLGVSTGNKIPAMCQGSKKNSNYLNCSLSFGQEALSFCFPKAISYLS